MKIATSPIVYRGTHVFMPEKLGKLQGRKASRRTDEIYGQKKSFGLLEHEDLSVRTETPGKLRIGHVLNG